MKNENKVAIVTGANSGIGYAVAKGLLLSGARVVLACRSLERAEAAKARLIKETNLTNLEIILCDLSLQKSIEDFYLSFSGSYSSLDILCNCAGHINFKRELTGEGIETNFATNVLGPYYLTTLLLPLLTQSKPTAIINIAGEFHRFHNVNFNNLFYQKSFSALKVGSVSMLERIMLTYSLAEKLKSTNILVNSFHPGNVGTELAEKLPFGYRLLSKVLRPFKLTPDEGADTCLWLTSNLGVTGKYFIERKVVSSSKFSYDLEAQKKLMDVCDGLIISNKRESV